AVTIGNEFSHPGAGVADGSPGTRPLDDGAPLRERLVLRTVEVFQVLPAALGAAKGLHIEFDIEAFGSEKAFLHCNEIVEPHALRSHGRFDCHQTPPVILMRLWIIA